MASLPITELLRRTATHEADAWLLSIAVGALAAFAPLLLFGGARREEGPAGARLGGGRRALAFVLAGAIAGAAIGAALLPIALRLPAALATGSVAPLVVGDRMAIGALIGFVIAGAIGARRARLDAARALDRLAPSMGVLVVAGRVGCFLEGCDFGRATSAAWGVTYPAGSHAFEAHVARGLVGATETASLPVHPAQLYEALVGVAMTGLAIAILRRDERASASIDAGLGDARRGAGAAAVGSALRGAVAVYALGRLAIEPLRGDVRPMLGALSMPQWLAIALLAACVASQLGDRGAPTLERRSPPP